MDKRKTNGRTTEEVDEYAVKRRKRTPPETPDSDNAPKSLQKLGEMLIALLEGTLDRRRHPIIEPFEKLPTKRELPDYYQVIQHPIDLEAIRNKLPKYKTPEDLIADFELMCKNAQEYNKPGSAISNAAYKISVIVAKFVTDNAKAEALEAEAKVTKRDEGDDDDDEDGSLKDVMLLLIKDLTEVKDANNERAADHFMELPLKRQFPDYYEAVANPTSITLIRRGVKRGEYENGRGMLKFEETCNRLFTNAELYNAKGSEILDDTKRLKTFFKPRMAEIKEKFADLLVNMPSEEESYSTPDNTSDNQDENSTPPSESPESKLNEKNGVAGRKLRGRPPRNGSPIDVEMSNSGSRPSTARHSSRGMSAMDIDSASPRRSVRPDHISASPAPKPGSQPPVDLPKPVTTAPVVPAPPSRPMVDMRRRPPGKTAEKDCPIRHLQIFTSPRINPTERFNIKIYPDAELIYSSHIFHLTHDNSILHFRPYMNPAIFDGKARYNVNLTVNQQPIQLISSAFEVKREGAPHYFECVLRKGMTNVVHCVAEMVVQGQNGVDRTEFFVHIYVAPQY